MKKLVFLSTVLLLLSGCSLVNINEQSIDEIINSVITGESDLKSVSLDGYSYFLPQGVNLSRSDAGNSILYYNHKKMYLYVDFISYYHKVDFEYKTNTTAYYSKSINVNGHKGYIEITEVSGRYFVEFMYHYSKMEAYVEKEDLNKTITVMGHILNSVKFNDVVIDSLVGENSLNFTEEKFNIFKPNGESNSNFLDYVEQYDDGRTTGKDEAILELEENIE